ncbi:MAG: hypothetical protein ACAH22_18910, partial [Tardiphaga sp.]
NCVKSSRSVSSERHSQNNFGPTSFYGFGFTTSGLLLLMRAAVVFGQGFFESLLIEAGQCDLCAPVHLDRKIALSSCSMSPLYALPALC